MYSRLEYLQRAYNYYNLRLSPFALAICAKYGVAEHPFFLTILYVLRHHKITVTQLKRYMYSRLCQIGYTYQDIKKCVDVGYRCYVFDMDGKYVMPGEKIKECLSA